MILTDNVAFYLDPSFYISVSSAIIGLAAFIVSIYVTRKESRNHFERTVEECLMPVSMFIQDSYVSLSNKSIGTLIDAKNMEKRLIEGIHSLYVFALTNHYKYLKEACTIRFPEDEKNKRSFAYCLFELENKYIDFRKNKALKNIKNESDIIFLNKTNLLFRDFLELIAKYMFLFKSKNNIKIKKYYKELNRLYEEVKNL